MPARTRTSSVLMQVFVGWTAVVAFAAFYVVKLVVGLRVPEKEEREGLDITSHGERAYDL